jgi:hypothetical protein
VSDDNQPTPGDNERLIPWNVLLTVFLQFRKQIGAWSFCLTTIVASLGAVYLFWLQPTRGVSTIDFRPTFTGAGVGAYPNGTVFAPSDIIAQPNLNIVYDTNSIQDYCSRETFRAGFFIERWSSQAMFLQFEYAARLGDLTLLSVDRERLEVEYQAKQDTLPLQYRLTYVHPTACAAIPQVLVNKSLADVLSAWASESVTKRGVLDIEIAVFSPSILDGGQTAETLTLLRVDLVRTALLRVLGSVRAVMEMPGASVVHARENGPGFAEIEARLTDLIESVVQPLAFRAGRSMREESVLFVTGSIALAERSQTAAASQSAAFRDALREFSGVAGSTEAGQASSPANTRFSETQTLQPQISLEFLDRVVEMTSQSTSFRQQLTLEMVNRSVLAVDSETRATYYRELLDSITGSPETEDLKIEDQLNQAVNQGKQLISQLNELYDQFSRTSLRAASALYQTEAPIFNQVSRAFTMRAYVTLVVGTFFAILSLAFAGYLIRNLIKTSSSVP